MMNADPSLPETDPPAPALPAPPASADLNVLQTMGIEPLEEMARSLGLRPPPSRGRHLLVAEIVRGCLARRVPVTAEGILEAGTGGSGMLRWPEFNFAPFPEDVFVSPGLLRHFGLWAGNRLSGLLRPAREKEKYAALDRVISIEGRPVAEWTAPKRFDALTPLFPTGRIILESPRYPSSTVRAIDLIATLGKGQRGLILAPPRTGKTVLLKHIAKAMRASCPELHLMLLLVDERPEEVSDFKLEVDAEIYSSTFDEPPARHIQVSEIVCERGKRLVEQGKHVVILLDSITRLSRGYNAMQPKKGRIMSGGLDSKALIKPKRFFSAARNTEEGGSLTILATALVDTGSRADEVIFEEFKGTGNMELHLDRELVDKRIFPAVQIMKSGTRREELLYHPDELPRIQILRKQLAALPPLEAMEVLLENIEATKTNTELLLGGLKS
jgi:transcription termination factor Rho